MSMVSRLHTAAWFLARPSFWPQMLALGRHVLVPSPHEDTPAEATAWAQARAIPFGDALRQLGVVRADADIPPPIAPDLLAAAEDRVTRAEHSLGGAGDIDLLHGAILALGAKRVVETGVAYGWSSFAALAALRETGGRLVSVDMPYPKMGAEDDVGIVVPEEWRKDWTLIRRPDRNGLKIALKEIGGTIDLAHYDSDKTYAGRMYGLPLLWDALRPGGLLIVDDIQDNVGFRDFAEASRAEPAVTESEGKYVGIIRKPG